MTDLSHWDFADEFKGKEAAELMMGIAPEQNDGWGSLDIPRMQFTQKITPVLRRMAEAYKGAIHTLAVASSWDEDPKISLENFPMNPLELHTEHMIKARRSPSEFRLSLFGSDKLQPSFDSVYFGRDEIYRWLGAIGMQSAYQFNRKLAANKPAETVPPNQSRWPWGAHHTELLGHLDAAARRYWGAGYDPSDIGTASTNATVSEWLQTERKVSRTMADAIASLLRPDGLPTGPRK